MSLFSFDVGLFYCRTNKLSKKKVSVIDCYCLKYELIMSKFYAKIHCPFRRKEHFGVQFLGFSKRSMPPDP